MIGILAVFTAIGAVVVLLAGRGDAVPWIICVGLVEMLVASFFSFRRAVVERDELQRVTGQTEEPPAPG